MCGTGKQKRKLMKSVTNFEEVMDEGFNVNNT